MLNRVREGEKLEEDACGLMCYGAYVSRKHKFGVE